MSRVKSMRFGDYPLHPYLFSLYSIFFLYSKNVHELTGLHVVIRPVVFVLVATSVILGVCYLIFRQLDRAALLATILSLSYIKLLGAIMKPLVDWLDEGLDIQSALINTLAFGALLIASIYLVFRIKRVPPKLGANLNVIACILLVLPIGIVLFGEKYHPPETPPASDAIAIPESIADRETLPDVYFIMLDGYGRADTLAEVFDYDNTPFLDAMRSRGFFVAEASETSYLWTIRSYCAMLNMDYLENLIGPEYYDNEPALLHFIQNNAVQPLFRRLGYSLMGLESGMPPTTPSDYFDVVVEFDPPWNALSPFELAMVEFTGYSRLFEFLGVNFTDVKWTRRVQYTLENLDAPTRHKQDGPVYFQSHVMSPHEPLIMLADGTYKPNRLGNFNAGALAGGQDDFEIASGEYIKQLQGLNGHILNAIDRILKNSTTPPIIAIVSDHGPRVNEDPRPPSRAAGTLFMLHLPGVNETKIPHDINPVELFPTILNQGLGFNLPMPEKSEEIP